MENGDLHSNTTVPHSTKTQLKCHYVLQQLNMFNMLINIQHYTVPKIQAYMVTDSTYVCLEVQQKTVQFVQFMHFTVTVTHTSKAITHIYVEPFADPSKLSSAQQEANRNNGYSFSLP